MGLSDLERQKRRLLAIEARADDPRPAQVKQIGYSNYEEMLDYHHLQWCLDPQMMDEEADKNRKAQDDWLSGKD